MNVTIGSDHAGYELKQHVIAVLKELGHDVDDIGTDSTEPVDYPPICAAVGRAVVRGGADRGIVIGGSGQGEQLAANKVRGVRAALCGDAETARMARRYNHANVLALSLRATSPPMGREIVEAFLAEPDGADDFDLRNVAELRGMEEG